MPKKKPSLPRLSINLANALNDAPADTPSAGTVAVTFNARDNSVSLPANADITVNKNKMKILFSLTANNVPQGAAAVIEGIEFPKPNEPSGTHAPASVFEDQSTFTDQNNAAHTVYGQWKANQNQLKLIDDDNVGQDEPEQDYGYKVWVKYTDSSGTKYYSSADPQVKNEPTTGG